MLVTCAQMSEAERRLFSGGISPEPYMNEAGRRCAAAILSFSSEPARAAIFCGKGNNGGDALVVARWLKRNGWKIELHFSHGPEGLSALARKKLAEFEGETLPSPVSTDPRARPLVLVDGLVGIGAKGDLRGGILALAEQCNAMRLAENATCFAIDLPSGLDADTGRPGAGAIVADFTLSITAAKVGFAADSAINHVGRLVEIPLEIPIAAGDHSRRFLFPSNLRPRLAQRPYDTHKGGAGRVLIVAGSRGFAGAATLAALGASRGGGGLVTVCVPEAIYGIVAAQCPPEVMVRPYEKADELDDLPADVLAVGPGLGKDLTPGLIERLVEDARPIVIDADALNALAASPELLSRLPSTRLLTPHPGELVRLAGGGTAFSFGGDKRQTAGDDPARLGNRLKPALQHAATPTEKAVAERGVAVGERCEIARRCADAWGVSLLYKGARTIIATPGHPLELNTTGHPGMASGGMGDVLTGLCASLAAQGLALHDAACVGSWLLGRAAELAVLRGRIAPESLSAPLVAEHLGAALRDLRNPDSL